MKIVLMSFVLSIVCGAVAAPCDPSRKIEKKKPETRCGKLLAGQPQYGDNYDTADSVESAPTDFTPAENFENYPAPSKNFENYPRPNPEERAPYKPGKQMGGPSGPSQFDVCDSPKQMG